MRVLLLSAVRCSTVIPALHARLVDQRSPVSQAAVTAAVTLMQHCLAQQEAASFVNQLLQEQQAAAADGGANSGLGARDMCGLLEVLLWVSDKQHTPVPDCMLCCAVCAACRRAIEWYSCSFNPLAGV